MTGRGRGWPTRRQAVLGSLLGAGAGLLGACGPDGAPEPPALRDPDETTITWFASSITQSQNDPRRILVDVYERDNLGSRVREISANSRTDTMREILRRTIAGGAADPDVYLGDVIWPADFGHGGIAEPLDDRLPADFWRRYDADLVEAARYRDRIYAAPMYADQGVLYYRPALVGAPPATWEELAAVCRDVARPPGMHGFVWPANDYEGLTCCWAEFAAAAGAPLPDAADDQARLDSAEAVQALAFLRRLIVAGVSPPEVTRFQEPQAMQQFNAGRALFMRGWSTAWVSMNDSAISRVAGDVAVAPLPAFAPGSPRFSTVGGWSLFLNPHSRRFPQSTRFVDWMTDTSAQKILTRAATIPTNRTVRSDPTLLSQYPPLQAAGESTKVHRPAGFPNYAEITRAIYTNVNLALRGQVEPAEALHRAQRGFEAVRRGRPR